jgi:hypothetical protein
VAATLGTRLRLLTSKRLRPDGNAVSAILARWSTRLSRLMVAAVMAFALLDQPPQKRPDKSANPPIEILRTKPVPMDGQRPPARPSAGH